MVFWDYRNDPCYRRCVFEHEEYHRKMVEQCCPEICKCYPENVFDIDYKDDDTKQIWECPAYVAGLYCLQQMIEEIEKEKKHEDCSRRLLQEALEDLSKGYEKECPKSKLPTPIKPPPNPPECRK